MFLYTVFTVIFSPLIYLWLELRLRKGKEDPQRFAERLGHASIERPEGKLVWMHGASVGECLSMLPVVNKIIRENMDVHVMVTSGTRTSAAVMAKRLPERAFHQYIPVDMPWAVKSFVKYWKPDLALWFESEFWPNILKSTRKSGCPIVLLNGRISDRSFARWKKQKWFIRSILRLFTLCFGQSQEDAWRLQSLGAKDVVYEGNLKCAADLPEFDEQELQDLLAQIGDRPRFLAASTHSGEDELILECTKDLKHSRPNFLTIIAPRHPHRGDDIEALFTNAGFKVARRSRGEKITDKTDLYLADTIGEMGLIYQLSELVFVGGSLVKEGGQNMLEPMRFGRVVFVGPYTFNFKEIVKNANDTGALIQVAGLAELLGVLVWNLAHPEMMDETKKYAISYANSEALVLDRVYETLQKKVGL